MEKHTLGIDPQDRKVILVASDRGLRRILAQLRAQEWGARISSHIGRAAFPLNLLVVPAIKGFYATQPHVYSRTELFDEIVDKLDLGAQPALISPVDAMKHLRFGVGHTPNDGSVYLQHPMVTDLYVAPTEYSKVLAKEKEAAFRKLASALGAKKLTLVSGTVVEKSGRFSGKFPLEAVAAEIGVKVEFDSAGSLVKKVYSEFGRPRSDPRVPPELQSWVEMDPDLRTMAADRIEGHLLRNSITLEFKEGMGVGGELAARLAGKGLAAGMRYNQILHSTWLFDVEYYPIAVAVKTSR